MRTVIFFVQIAKEDDEEDKEKPELENAEVYQQQFGTDEGEDQDEEKTEEETQIDVEIPYSKFNLGSEIAFVKLPNFLSVETKPFDPMNYEDEVEEDEVLDEEGRARLKLRVRITIQLDVVQSLVLNSRKHYHTLHSCMVNMCVLHCEITRLKD